MTSSPSWPQHSPLSISAIAAPPNHSTQQLRTKICPRSQLKRTPDRQHTLYHQCGHSLRSAPVTKPEKRRYKSKTMTVVQVKDSYHHSQDQRNSGKAVTKKKRRKSISLILPWIKRMPPRQKLGNSNYNTTPKRMTISRPFHFYRCSHVQKKHTVMVKWTSCNLEPNSTLNQTSRGAGRFSRLSVRASRTARSRYQYCRQRKLTNDIPTDCLVSCWSACLW